MDGVLHKPFTIATMAEILERFIGGSAAATSHDDASRDSEADAGAVLDSALVDQLRQMAALGRGDFVERVTGLYMDHAPKSLEEARAALDGGDAPALARAAHALKSMSLNVGARRVSALAAEIEKQARADELCRSDDLEALKAAMEEACASLQDIAKAA